jgi:hypothetical protein
VSPQDERAFLDRPAARGLAALVLVLCGALLIYLHRDDLWPADAPEEKASDDPAAPCIEQRFAEIDAMIADGVVGEGQAALFKRRAEAMCRATEGGDGRGAPPAAN